MERIGTLIVAPTTDRKAEPGRFANALRTATAEVVSGVTGSLTLAAPYVPGGAVLAGALRSTVPPLAASAAASSGPGTPTGTATTTAPAVGAPTAGAVAPLGTSTVPGLPVGAGGGAAVAGAGSGGDLMEATRILQQQSQSFNLQYLQLQESMQRESREFTSMTNVMKVRHDSAKAAISNIH